MLVWRIAADTPEYTALDMKGLGAKATGGRWNRIGTAVVYAAGSRALACLETVVHLAAGSLPLNRYLVEIDIPDDIWAARQTLTEATAPVGWDALPAGKVSLDIGEEWAKEAACCVLQVPSVIVPEESNILINPAHPDAVRITATKVRKWLYDGRVRD